MAVVGNAQAGTAAPGAGIRAAHEPSTRADAALAPGTAAAGDGPPRYDVPAHASERPLAKMRRRTRWSATSRFFALGLRLVFDQGVDVVVRVEEPRPDTAPVLGLGLLLEPAAFREELLLQPIDAARREADPRLLADVGHIRVVVRGVVVDVFPRGEGC